MVTRERHLLNTTHTQILENRIWKIVSFNIKITIIDMNNKTKKRTFFIINFCFIQRQIYMIYIFSINIEVVRQNKNIVQISKGVIKFVYQILFVRIFIYSSHKLGFVSVQKEVHNTWCTIGPHGNLTINGFAKAYKNVV